MHRLVHSERKEARRFYVSPADHRISRSADSPYTPPTTAMDMGCSVFGSHPSHLDPDRVFALVASRRPDDLAGYLASIPGGRSIRGQTLLPYQLRRDGSRGPDTKPDEDSWTLYLAQYARTQAIMSRLCAVHMIGNPLNVSSAAAPRQDPVLDQLSASDLWVRGVTFPPFQANSNDVLIQAATLNQLSASGSSVPSATFNQKSTFLPGSDASAYDPLRDNSTFEPLVQLSLGQPGSGAKQMTPHDLMRQIVSSLTIPGAPLHAKLDDETTAQPSLGQSGSAPPLATQASRHDARTETLVFTTPPQVLQKRARGLVQVVVEEQDTEREVHKDFQMELDKCGADNIICLICFISNASKKNKVKPEKMRKNRLERHCKIFHGGRGVKCEQKGCQVRARNIGDIGAHQFYCHRK